MFLKGFHSVTLYRIVAALTVLSSPLVFFMPAPSFYPLLALAATLLIVKLGQHIGQHRYFAHKAFRTGEIRQWILGYFATLSLTGGPLVYAAVHRLHHKHSDTELDSHPLHKNFWKAFFVHINDEDVKMSPFVIKDLLRNKQAQFYHNYYWHIILSYIGVLALIDPLLVLYCWSIPVTYSKFVSGVGTTFVHMWGYKPFDTKDKSTNSIINHILTMGEGMHNNHHFRPAAYDNNIRNKWYEFDWLAPIIKVFFDVRKQKV